MSCTNDTLCFQNNEELVYKIYYSLGFISIPAGEVIFRVDKLDSLIHFDVVGKTYAAYDPFFKVRDSFKSTVNSQDLLPQSFIRNVHEGSYHRYDSIYFHQDSFLLEEYFGKNKTTTEQFQFNTNHCVRDMLSVVYFMRCKDWTNHKEDESEHFDIFFDKEFFPLSVKLVGRERKRVKGLGKFHTMKLQPQLIKGNVFDEDNIMNIWVTDDENKVPLIIESPISVGSIKAILQSSSGLKYDSGLKPNQ